MELEIKKKHAARQTLYRLSVRTTMSFWGSEATMVKQADVAVVRNIDEIIQ